MILNKEKARMFEDFISEGRLTASEIARRHGMNQKSVYLFMEELEKDGILSSGFQGKNKLYTLNSENKEAVIQFVCAIEHLRTLSFYHDNPEIKLIAEKIIPHIYGMAAIFGSYAKRRQKKDSDLDIFVIGRYDEKEIAGISETFGIDINIKLQRTFKEDTMTLEVRKDHILMKESEGFIRRWIS